MDVSFESTFACSQGCCVAPCAYKRPWLLGRNVTQGDAFHIYAEDVHKQQFSRLGKVRKQRREFSMDFGQGVFRPLCGGAMSETAVMYDWNCICMSASCQ